MSNTTIRLPEDDSDTPDFRVAIHARTKHADLWPLAQKMGSQRKLAEALGVTPMTVGLWVTLQRFPCHHLHPDRWQPVIDTLYGLTGKTFEELWPADLRKMIGEGRASAQATRVMQYGDACYAIEQARRLGSPTPLQAIEDRETREQGEEALELLLRSLPQRHATVIRLRYGLDGNRPQIGRAHV